jgi:enoyl-CoA hydratase/carnithine racemase
VFSAGGNIKDMRKHFGTEQTAGAIRDDYRFGIQRLTWALYNLEVPTIAAVNGPAIGAGCDLTRMCDMQFGGVTRNLHSVGTCSGSYSSSVPERR